MPIPPLDANGFLPEGAHECTLEELEEQFGQDQWVDNRLRQCRSVLCASLKQYVAALRGTTLRVEEVLVDGSFTTGKPEPGDVDLIVVLPADHDFSVDLRPFEYNLVSKKRVQKQGYPFDLFVVAAGSPKYHEALTLFRQVKNRAELTKGLLKVRP